MMFSTLKAHDNLDLLSSVIITGYDCTVCSQKLFPGIAAA